MTWIDSFVNGLPWLNDHKPANWKPASVDMTENTMVPYTCPSRISTLKATSSGGLEAIPTSKIEKERDETS